MNFIKKYICVTLGGIFQGFGMGIFLFPQSIPSGGAGGIAILLNHWFSIHMGPALWIVNFSLLIIGVKYLGKRFALWTFLSITMTSLSIDFFEQFFMLTYHHVLLDLVIGSVFLGTGIGLLMRNGVSNGGIGVLALIIVNKKGALPGRPLFLMNSFIFVVTAAIISWEIIILALLSQWIATKVVDVIYELNISHLLFANK